MRYALIVLAIGIAFSPAAMAACPSGWQSYPAGQSCFFFNNAHKNMHDAEADCVAKGAHLASIHTDDEGAFVANYAAGVETRFFVFLGLKRNGGSFQWSDNSAFDFNLWSNGQPAAGKNCVVFTPVDGTMPRGHWATFACSSMRPYVCKKPSGGTGTSSTGAASTTTPLITTSRRTTTGMLTTTVTSSPGCPGSDYGGSSGTIKSPNYPSNYGNNLDCDYRITLSNTHKAVQLTFTAFNTENRYDYVEIFDGLGANANLIIKLTGGSVDLSTPYKSTTNKMRVHFHSDRSVVRSGWTANYAEAVPPTTTTTTTMAPTTPSAQCGGDYSFDPATNLCYRYDKRLMSWMDAKAACTTLGGHIASVHNDAQNNFIAQYIVSQTAHVDRWFAWLGARKTGAAYAWDDGSSFDYTKWLQGEPADAEGHCASIASWTPIGWRALPCTYQRPFVCIKSPNVVVLY